MAVRSRLPWPWRVVAGIVVVAVIGGMWWWGFDFGQFFGGVNRPEIEARIAVHRPPDTDLALVLAVEDNLVKGAAGQAIQNMNLMFGFAETAGLTALPVLP